MPQSWAVTNCEQTEPPAVGVTIESLTCGLVPLRSCKELPSPIARSWPDR
jgi:hypothetical protein